MVLVGSVYASIILMSHEGSPSPPSKAPPLVRTAPAIAHPASLLDGILLVSFSRVGFENLENHKIPRLKEGPLGRFH